MNDILTEKEYQHFIMEQLKSNNGYRIRHATKEGGDYDRRFAMDRNLLLEFLGSTQPKGMAEIRKIYKDKADGTVISFINQEIVKKGSGLIPVLKNGVDLTPSIHLDLMYTRPATDFNKDLLKKYEQNIFSVMEEVWPDDDSRIDLVIFLNGLAIMSFELKCNPAGQSYGDAIEQYRTSRDPKNRLFLFKTGCFVNFAMDLEQVYMATRLSGDSTFFLPFNRGCGKDINRGAGNEINEETGFGVDYMWDDILKKDTVLDLISKYIFVEKKEKIDPDTKKKKKSETLIFPRYHQLDCVRKVMQDVQEHGTSQNYLIEHSAGSGKTNSITWLAYRFASLHNAENQQIFDKIIVVTDRVIVDQQLQRAILSIEHKEGMVRNMDDKCTSADLQKALESNVKIVGTTIQKFPYIVDSVRSLKDKHFAVIIDEAHSSTAGKDMVAIMKSLSAGNDDAVEEEDADTSTVIENELSRMGKPENVSFFAFTATPKPTTMALFGRLDEHGQRRPFHIYSMKQAIEEGFILDVLSDYTTYKTFFHINKTIEEDPRYKSGAAKKKIARFAILHPTNIAQRIEIIIEHFRSVVKDELGGKAKAMVITGSRQEAVRYKQEFERYIERKGYKDVKALVAFSGTVKDEGVEYTESGLNGFSDSKTADAFDTDEYQVLLVANKYQTGFDQPKLCAMYVMKKLKGVNAVQTLSRLNRICPPYDKKVFVLDFVNDYEDMQKAFAPYYSTTILSNSVTPSAIYDLSDKIDGYFVLDPDDIDKFNDILYGSDGDMRKVTPNDRKKLLAYLGRADKRIKQEEFKKQKEIALVLRHFRRLYEFLMLVSNLKDPELHRKYRFIDYLLAWLNIRNPGNGFDLKGKIEASDFVQHKESENKNKKLTAKPVIKLPTSDALHLTQDKEEKLSAIIAEINSKLGKNYDNDVAVKAVLQIRDILMKSDDLKRAAQNNTEKDFEFSFNDHLDEALIEGYEQNKDFFSLLLENDEAKKQVMGIFVDGIYKSLREAK